MKKIVFPLNLRMKRPEVGNLHQALTFLGLEIAATEKDSQRFGTSTREAVRKFQAEHQLAVIGMVNEATANLLNRLLAECSALDAEVAYEVEGVVRTADGAPTAGLTVQAFDRDVSREELLGSTVTNAEGVYEIRFAEAQFKRTSGERGGPEVFIRVTNEAGKVLGQSKTISNAPQEVHIDLTLPASPAVEFVVHGRVTTSDGQLLEKLTVKAFDRNVGEDDTPLGQATTDAEGNYSITYTLEQVGGKDAADLVISVYRGSQLLQTSDVIFNAQPTLTHDFVIAATMPPEFRTLIEKIQPLLRNKISIGRLAQAQINFLGHKTGLNAQKIGRLAQSHALAGDDQTLAAFYYGLLSQNMPTDPAALLQRPRASIQSALDRAAIFSQIPRPQPGDVDNILNVTFPRLRAENLLKPAAQGQKPSLGDLLRTMPTPLPEDSQTSLANLVAQNGIRYEQLPKQLESAGLGPYAAVIERTLRLANVTRSHLPLMERLQQRTCTDSDGSLRSLTELRRDEWIDLAYEYGVPADSKQTPEAYASQLERAVDTLHPTAMLAARLNTGDLVIRRPGFEKAGAFLTNNPDLDILHTNLPVYAEQANFNGVQDKEQPTLIKSLLKLQRVKRLSTSWDEAGAMLNVGLESARDVVSAGATRFAESLRGQVAPLRARLIYDRARQVHDITLFLMAGSLPRYAPTPVAAMGNANRIQESSASKTNRNTGEAESPTLQSLFGPLDNVTSDQSVLSPAAYYVDLLQFLNPNLDGQTSNPSPDEPTRDPSHLQALLARRPDLVDLQLSPKNAETELPHIDLVLEILENAVALPASLTLPAGTDVEMALSTDPLPKVITDQLQRTSLGIIGTNLKATHEAEEQRRLTGDPADDWIVSDKRQRWNIRNYSRGLRLYFYRPANMVAISPDEVDLAQFVHDLDAHTLSENVKDQFQTWYPVDNRRSNYLYIQDFDVHTVTPGRQWRVGCTLAVRVLIQLDLHAPGGTLAGGTLELQTPSGTNLFGPQHYPLQSIGAMLDGLQHNEIVWPLARYLPANLEYVVNQAPDAWLVCLKAPEPVNVIFIPDVLEICSLAYQTAGSSADLIACPENQNPLAYKKLRNPEAYGMSTFPWSLPFNLPWESVHACLERAGVTRRELIERAHPEKYLNDVGWAWETLSICPEEATLIVTCASGQEPKLWSYWGFKPGPNNDWNQCKVFDAAAGRNEPDPSEPDYALKPKSKVSVLLQQARIGYDELLSILRTYYVGGSSTFEIKTINQDKSDRGPCNLYVDGLTADHFDRMHRFVRLWRRLGWPIDDVDRAITSIGGIPDQTLIFLAHIKKLQEWLNVPPRLLIDWWLDLLSYTHADAQSLYEQIFLNPRFQSSPNDAFLLNAERTQLLNGDIHRDKVALIAAALGIRQDDLDQLLTSFGIADTLDVHDLFELYRTTSLARALGLTIPDYVCLVRLTGAAPFVDSASLVKFCETVQFIQSSGFTVQELAYLLEQDTLAAQELDLNSQRVSQMLKSIRSAIQARLQGLEQPIRNVIANNPGGLTVRGRLDDQDALAADTDSLHILFNPGDSASGVTRDLLLPVQGANGTRIAWSPDPANPDAVSIILPLNPRAHPYARGIVTRPAAGTENAKVTLTATVSIGNPPDTIQVTRPFDLVVLQELNPDDAVRVDAAALGIRFSPGNSTSAVTRLLVLPTGGANGTRIDWVCANTNLIEIEGPPPVPNANYANYAVAYVHRPPSSESDALVLLTATIFRPDDNARLTRTFRLTVLRELTDEQAVAADAALLAIGFADGDGDTSVSCPVFLPTSGVNGTTIQWSCGNTDLIQIEPGGQDPQALPGTIDWTASDAELAKVLPHFGHYDVGRVTKPTGQDADVVLTATITRNNVSSTRVLYPKTLLNLDPFDARRLAVVLSLVDPSDGQGVNIPSMLRDVAISQVASLFNLEISVARKLLTAGSLWTRAILHDPSEPARDAIRVFLDPDFVKKEGEDTQAASDLMRLLNKVSLILSRLQVKPAEVAWIAPPFGMLTLDFNQLPLAGPADAAALIRSWKSLVTLFQIRGLRPRMDALLRDYIAALSCYQWQQFVSDLERPGGPINPRPGGSPLQPPAGALPPVGPSASSEDLVALLGQGLGLPKEWDYVGIAGALGITELDDCRDPQKLDELVNLFAVMRKLGATMANVSLLTAVWPPAALDNAEPDAATQAQVKARALLQAKYGPDSWNGIIKPISDALRIRQRDTLVDCLIFTQNTKEHPIKDVNDLYEYYLIDPQMSPCMLTSRLVQATAAVQLFVQRCLLNLEAMTLNEDDRRRWEWMKNYRVWEANRKVFLYPENWLYPELRDDKTETFKSLESGISQGEPRYQLAKENLLDYMDALNDLAKITVYGMCEYADRSDPTQRPVRILYVVGRSPNQPYNYFWRQCTSLGDPHNMKWSGWERIADIDDDHVMPFVMDGNLHIAWPTITKTTKSTQTSGSTTTTDLSKDPTAEDCWEIKLNWIRHTNKGWTKKKVSNKPDWPDRLPCQRDDAGNYLHDPNGEITFRVKPDLDQSESIDFCVYANQLKSDQPQGTSEAEPDQTPYSSYESDLVSGNEGGYAVLNIMANYPELHTVLTNNPSVVEFVLGHPDLISILLSPVVTDYPTLVSKASDAVQVAKTALDAAVAVAIAANPAAQVAAAAATTAAFLAALPGLPSDEEIANAVTTAVAAVDPATSTCLIAYQTALTSLLIITSNQTTLTSLLEFPRILRLIVDYPDLVRLIGAHPNWWGYNFSAKIRVNPFIKHCGYDEHHNEIFWYSPDANCQNSVFRFWYVTDFSDSVWNSSDRTNWYSLDLTDQHPDGYYECNLDLKAFEAGGSTKYLRQVEIYTEISGGANSGKLKLITVFDIAADGNGIPQVIKNFHQNVIAGPAGVNRTLHLNPVGRFILNTMGDITVGDSAGVKVAPPIDAANCYANGYVSADDGLRLKTDGTDAFAISNITVQGLVIPSARLQGELNNEYVWYFEYPPSMATMANTNQATLSPPLVSFKMYIEGVITKNNQEEKTVNAYLEIFDNLDLTAQLRTIAYKDFDGIYLLENQKYLQQVYNFVPSYHWNGSIYILDNDDWIDLWNFDQTGFDLQAPSAPYNWEILYHAPMLVAEFLTKQQRFEDAEKWLHFIFNPMLPNSSGDAQGASRFWKFIPFRQLTNGDNLQALFNLLAEQADNISIDPSKQKVLGRFSNLIDDWRDNPFLPFRIARNPLRWQSFEWRTIFAYLDNLLAWGDQMFRRFTRESINEAIQYYVLASKLLGPRPKSIQSLAQPPAQSYRELYGKWDDFSNAWYAFDGPVSMILMSVLGKDGLGADRELGPILDPDHSLGEVSAPDHTHIPGDIYLPSTEPIVVLSSLPMLYFSIPPNDKLMGYWDTIEDRLFKIRTCKDIDGATRKLALFSPPIDPLLLVRATAAGLDIDTVLADMDAPVLPYRFNIIVQKANEICSEVKALGSSLLSALEKKDAERLALLRSGHEVALLNLVTQVKQYQLAEANANIESLNQSKAVAMARFTQYQKLLGKAVTIDSSGLVVLSAGSSLQIAANASGDETGLGLIQYEVDQLSSLDEAHTWQEGAGIASTVAGILHAMPEFQNGGVFAYVHMGGMHLGNAANAVAAYLSLLAGNASHEANRKGMLASYQRRQDEWVHQSKLAFEEMKQIDKQIIAAGIRKDLAQKELDNHLQQIVDAQVVDDFMHDKYTNQELYSWMMGQISNVYFRCYQLAYDTAKRAEKAFRSELGLEDSNYIQFGYWDSLKKGLLAGENLSLDLKRMEVAYLEQNRRDFEITKYISLLQLDPMALIELKEASSCEVNLPEALFDMDLPGHYFRRIKSVSLTIPSIVGPYTSVNCTLTLLDHRYRRSPLAHNATDYAEQGPGKKDDPRFVYGRGPIQSIVTSHAQNDSGTFELNFHDERYLPFEGAGAISTWRIELPKTFKQFDYDTISDVILHIRYTARQDGALADKVNSVLSDWLAGLKQTAESSGELYRLFSLRHEFVNEWYGFARDIKQKDAAMTLALSHDRFPFYCLGYCISIDNIKLVLLGKTNGVVKVIDPTSLASAVTIQNVNRRIMGDVNLPLIEFTMNENGGVPVLSIVPGGKLTLNIEAAPPDPRLELENILLICHYSLKQ